MITDDGGSVTLPLEEYLRLHQMEKELRKNGVAVTGWSRKLTYYTFYTEAATLKQIGDINDELSKELTKATERAQKLSRELYFLEKEVNKLKDSSIWAFLKWRRKKNSKLG
jgi:hypothetical protein